MGQHILRLKRRPDFLRVAATRQKWVAPGLILQVRAHPADGKPGRTTNSAFDPTGKCLRVGFTVSKKVGNSVQRNRAKRRLRALVSEILPVHARPGFDLVLIGRRETIDRPWPKLKDDLLKALNKMGIALLPSAPSLNVSVTTH
jgi:ribonuclease P protein component